MCVCGRGGRVGGCVCVEGVWGVVSVWGGGVGRVCVWVVVELMVFVFGFSLSQHPGSTLATSLDSLCWVSSNHPVQVNI